MDFQPEKLPVVPYLTIFYFFIHTIKTFLPLFLLVRQPLDTLPKDPFNDSIEDIKFFAEDDSDAAATRNTSQVSSSSLPALAPCPAALLISLISNLLENYVDLFLDMQSIGGWQILGFLLQKMHPDAWDIQALNSLDALATVLFNSGIAHFPWFSTLLCTESSFCVDKSHFREFFRYSYLNLSMWARTTSSIQELLFSQITARVKAHPEVIPLSGDASQH